MKQIQFIRIAFYFIFSFSQKVYCSKKTAILNTVSEIRQIIDSVSRTNSTIKSTVSNVSTTVNSIASNSTLIKQENFGTNHNTSYTISSAGIYELYENIDFNASSPSQAIIINSSDVTLDLKSYKIHNSSSASVDGILINSNLENIVIKNGIIQDFTNRGIVIQSGCKNIAIYTLAFSGCNISAVEFLGSNTNPIKTSAISYCSIFDCSTNSASTRTLYMYYVNDSTITNCCINENGSASTSLSVLKLEQCSQCNATNIVINTNVATSTLTAFDLIATRYCNFQNIIASNNQSSETTNGFKLSSSSNGNEFFKCSAIYNEGSTDVSGFTMLDNCNGNSIKGCSAILNSSNGSNTSAVVQGFKSSNNSYNVFNNCLALNNSSPSSTATYGAIGFNVDTCTSCNLSRCQTFDQSSNGTSVGIKINVGTACMIKKCESRNQNVGYRLDPNNSLSHSFLKNISASNTTHYDQFPVGSNQNASDITTINGNLTSPWTNISVN